MKRIAITGYLILALFAIQAQETGNYILFLNNDTIHLNLDVEKVFKKGTSDELKLKLTQPQILTYADDMISFQYDKSMSVSNEDLGDGVEQCMIVQSTGNGFMVQKYKDFNPTGITSLMLNEITKESLNYGYKMKTKDYKKKLVSGHTLEGTHATLTYKSDKEEYIVATYGGKDEGILVITMLMDQESNNEKSVIDLFLESLRVLE